MPEHDVVRIPNPVLTRRAEPAGGADPDLADELVRAMRATPGCAGLAAPQLGASVRAVCVDVSHSPLVRREGWPHHGLVVLFDPALAHAEGTEVRREACVSVPTFAADVRRARQAVVRGVGPDGRPQELRTAGPEARALQHQLDHLDGVLILDRVARVRDRSRLTLGSSEIPFTTME